METEKFTKPVTEVLSPSKITDYFCQKTDLSNDLIQDAKSLNKGLSVYLTPKSSPVKDNDENSLSHNNSPADSDTKGTMQTRNCQSSKTSTEVLNSDRVCGPLSTENQSDFPEKCSKVVKSYESRTPSRMNGFTHDHPSPPSDASKRKSNQHRICHITRSSMVNPEKDDSHSASPVESSLVSSPSLPRLAKVRKNSKPKADGQTQTSATTQPASAKPKSGRRKKPEPVQSTAITDYFPIRRSGRQTKSQIEKETLNHLEKLIKSQCEDGLEVKEFECKGRGVVSTKVFDKGDFVVEYVGDLMDVDTAREKENQYALTPDIGCYMYFFCHKNKQYCVDATSESGRLGRLINHSRSGNCGTKVVMVDGVPHLILVAARCIQKGEELSYDYGDRSKEALDAHPWLKL